MEVQQDLFNLVDGALTDIAQSAVVSMMEAGHIKTNSFGITVGGLDDPNDRDYLEEFSFSYDHPDADHNGSWYLKNARGKAMLSAGAHLDSLEVVNLRPMLLLPFSGLFPWGGAVYDDLTGMIVSTSGFKEDEDIWVSRAVFSFMTMMLDRAGRDVLADARRRGQEGDGVDRFTKEP